MDNSIDITLLGSGSRWIGSGIRSFKEVIREVLSEAHSQIVMTAYSINDYDTLECLYRATENGVKVEIYVFTGDNRNIKTMEELKKISMKNGKMSVIEINDETLHAKCVVVDDEIIVIGSANATLSGMESNYELGVKIHHPPTARLLVSVIRRLK